MAKDPTTPQTVATLPYEILMSENKW